MEHRPQPPKQLSFASHEIAQKKRVTRREKFLAEMEQVVPWSRLEALIEPNYPTGGRVGRQPIGVPRMLRMYFLQQWFGLADEAVEDAVYESQSMRDFVGIDRVARGGARRDHAAEVSASARGARLHGAVVPGQQRGPGRARRGRASPGRRQDSQRHRMERAKRRSTITKMAEGTLKTLTKVLERVKAQIRARVEHPFHVVKNLFRHKKTRYKGLAKNEVQLTACSAWPTSCWPRSASWLCKPRG